MLIIVFRARAGQGAEAELVKLGTRMYELATAMPGFISYKDYQAADGESVSLVEFADAESLRAWREHPEHLRAQKLAREGLLVSYRVQVCEQLRVSAFGAT